MGHSLSHCVTAVCNTDSVVAFDFLRDVSRLGSWALGCWEAKIVADGVACGVSLFDGSRTYVRADADRSRLTVDFAVGDDPSRLVHRISGRVLPGAPLGYDAGSSLVSLLAWRSAAMSDKRWQRVLVSHDAEILLLQARLEAAA
jgi:hypothetical protein